MTTLLTDELWSTVEPQLPKHRPSPKGGHPRCNDRRCLEDILYVLRGGIAWGLPPKELAAGPGPAGRRFDVRTCAGVWGTVLCRRGRDVRSLWRRRCDRVI